MILYHTSWPYLSGIILEAIDLHLYLAFVPVTNSASSQPRHDVNIGTSIQSMSADERGWMGRAYLSGHCHPLPSISQSKITNPCPTAVDRWHLPSVGKAASYLPVKGKGESLDATRCDSRWQWRCVIHATHADQRNTVSPYALRRSSLLERTIIVFGLWRMMATQITPSPWSQLPVFFWSWS